MLADTFSVPVDGVSIAMNRIPSANPFVGVFTNDDGTLRLEIRQKSTKARKRAEMVLTVRKIATDPLTAVSAETSSSVGFYVDQPKVGFTQVELDKYMETLLGTAGYAPYQLEMLRGGV